MAGGACAWPRGAHVELTGRELEVLELMRQSLTTAAMAARLFIAEATVRSHIAAIVHKLGVEDRESAVRLLEEQFDSAPRNGAAN